MSFFLSGATEFCAWLANVEMAPNGFGRTLAAAAA